MGIGAFYALLISFGIHGVTSQDDSLRSALNAVERRQRYWLDKYPDMYVRENPVDLNYLPDSISVGENELTDYFADGSNDVGRQFSSSFRERQEEGREKQLEELSQRALSELEANELLNSYNYRSRDPWHKYRNNPRRRSEKMSPPERKRQFYPEFGYDGVGLRKRDKFISPEYPNDYSYFLSLNDDYPIDYLDTLDYPKRSATYHERENERIRPGYWSNFRHIPVTKRSSGSLNPSKESKVDKTDPKVEKDLSSVFTGSHKDNAKQEIKTEKVKLNATKITHAPKKVENVKEEQIANEKPIQLSKKSIDWSDYFGLDRRKKSGDDTERKWLMERYHKALAASKKNPDYHLQLLHENHEKKTTGEVKNNFDGTQLESMDYKLKALEDEIIDDALKFTGANEGVIDPEDIQAIKDGIISRLAKAYSIEKMRRALAEYRMLSNKEEDNAGPKDESLLSEEKRVSVPRKQAVDPEKEEQPEDNHIKCAQGRGDCDEDNYKTPIEVIEQMNYEAGGCPKIQRDCSQVAPLLGQYAKIFEDVCITHQMCLLCGNNSWYPATRQCNIIFLGKALNMCEGKTECKKELQKSFHLLTNINRNLRNNLNGDCNLICPDGIDDLK